METRKLITLETASALTGISVSKLECLIAGGQIRSAGIIENQTLISKATLKNLIKCNKIHQLRSMN